MKKIGITGQQGFIGRHLFNFLNLKEDIELVDFRRKYFDSQPELYDFVRSCDIIIHLAAMNRHKNPKVIENTNIRLVEQLIKACEDTNSTPWILFSSSTQESQENLYGRSKKVGRELLEQWAIRNHARTTGMIIPNVFGPFGKPFYNSVVATFCHQLANGEIPEIINDEAVDLIYINELTEDIYKIIYEDKSGRIELSHRYSVKVSKLLEKLDSFCTRYFQRGEIPSIEDALDLALFNTFRSYIPDDYYPRALELHSDDRGSFVEIIRTNSQGQFSFSTTVPGVTRGNHFHTRKAERFTVIQGRALIELRKIDEVEVIAYELDGETPAYVDMPIWYTHNITNIGENELVTLFWISEPYNLNDPDTYYINV